jgi:hypothetical protein
MQSAELVGAKRKESAPRWRRHGQDLLVLLRRNQIDRNMGLSTAIEVFFASASTDCIGSFVA